MKTPSGKLVLSTALLALAGCSADSGETYTTVDFALRYQNKDVSCADTLTGVGLSKSEVQLRDARVFIHDVHVVLDDGREEPLLLDDSQWQREGVALLDFADDTGLCETGNPEVNKQVSGTFSGSGQVVGVTFKVGVPESLNHLDSAQAPAPLNAPGMAWSWTGGYKYARIDVKSSMNDTWHLHLGAIGCVGSAGSDINCALRNIATVELLGTDDSQPVVVLDLGELYKGSDLDAQVDFVGDSISGCMAFPSDPECEAVFSPFGLTFGAETRVEQTVFRVE